MSVGGWWLALVLVACTHAGGPEERPFRFHVYNVSGISDAVQQCVDFLITEIESRGAAATAMPVKYRVKEYRHTGWEHWSNPHHHMSQYLVELVLYRYLRLHPLHTADPAEASAFVVIDVANLVIVDKIIFGGPCREAAVHVWPWVLRRQPYFNLSNGADHFVPTASNPTQHLHLKWTQNPYFTAPKYAAAFANFFAHRIQVPFYDQPPLRNPTAYDGDLARDVLSRPTVLAFCGTKERGMRIRAASPHPHHIPRPYPYQDLVLGPS